MDEVAREKKVHNAKLMAGLGRLEPLDYFKKNYKFPRYKRWKDQRMNSRPWFIRPYPKIPVGETFPLRRQRWLVEGFKPPNPPRQQFWPGLAGIITWDQPWNERPFWMAASSDEATSSSSAESAYQTETSDDEGMLVNVNSALKPVIMDVQPRRLPIGRETTVVVTGENLGQCPEDVRVWICEWDCRGKVEFVSREYLEVRVRPEQLAVGPVRVETGSGAFCTDDIMEVYEVPDWESRMITLKETTVEKGGEEARAEVKKEAETEVAKEVDQLQKDITSK